MYGWMGECINSYERSVTEWWNKGERLIKGELKCSVRVIKEGWNIGKEVVKEWKKWYEKIYKFFERVLKEWNSGVSGEEW